MLRAAKPARQAPWRESKHPQDDRGPRRCNHAAVGGASDRAGVEAEPEDLSVAYAAQSRTQSISNDEVRLTAIALMTT